MRKLKKSTRAFITRASAASVAFIFALFVAISFAIVTNVDEEKHLPPTPNEVVSEVSSEIPEPEESAPIVEESSEVSEETVDTVFYHLSAAERDVVEHIVAGEAGTESFEGQRAVAQCILEASIKDGIAPSEVRRKYQYAGWSDNVSDSVKAAVADVFDYGNMVTEEPIMYFYNPKLCVSTWHETQIHVITIGNHKFFAERGYDRE